LLQQKGWIGGGGWVHPKGANSMAVSWLNFKETLVGTGWAIALLLCTNGNMSPYHILVITLHLRAFFIVHANFEP